MRGIATVLVLAAAVCPAAASAQSWTCSAEASFRAGRVLAVLSVPAPGKLASRSTLTYEPAGVRQHFGFGIEYPAGKPFDRLPQPSMVQAVVPGSSGGWDADVLLTAGGRTFRSAANIYPKDDSVDRYVLFRWTGALRDALAPGGDTALTVFHRDGSVSAKANFTFAPAAEIEAAAARAFAAANGYAADPARSSYCTRD